MPSKYAARCSNSVSVWIRQKSGRDAVTDFVNDLRAMTERISFYVHDIPTGDKRAVTLGSPTSGTKRTGKIVAIVLTVVNCEIGRFQMLEDSFAVAQAARLLHDLRCRNTGRREYDSTVRGRCEVTALTDRGDAPHAHSAIWTGRSRDVRQL